MMINRVFFVLAWVAFAHALVVVAGVLDGMNSSLPIPTTEVGRFYSDYISTVFLLARRSSPMPYRQLFGS